MRRGRRLPELELSEEQRSALRGWTRRRKTAQALSLRARIVLRASEGLTATAIARETHACIQTVSKWWRRFDERGLDGLLDEPRPGQPRKLTDAQIEEVIVRTLESKPPAATHWSTRTMAQATGINQTAISRIWRAFSLAPHRSETFKLSKDPLFIDKVRDIVGLYLNPPERALAQVRHERGHRWPKWFRISSGYRRICTTFVLKSKMFWQADSELPEQRFLISCWLGNPPQPDLAAIGGGQDDVGALQRG